jgi:hypothetical protein
LLQLNSFRAKAELQAKERKITTVIYGIEEPETSQHPHNQRLLVRALREFAVYDQVILTTHTPMLARSLPDSPVTEGRRTVRTILVIDEAHNYLGQKNIFLRWIIREGRSKGVVMFFASKSPNDYQQKLFNFQELLEFTYIVQCDGVTSGSVQDILGCSARTAKDLQTEICTITRELRTKCYEIDD